METKHYFIISWSDFSAKCRLSSKEEAIKGAQEIAAKTRDPYYVVGIVGKVTPQRTPVLYEEGGV